MSRLRAVAEHGQSLWLDFIDRDLLDSGALARLIETDDIRGLTSNPAIFEKAIASGSQYDDALRTILEAGDAEPSVLFERMAVADIRAAADVMRPVYERTGGVDGYVSLEVAPHLCADAEATTSEARRLWAAVARQNLMIKVPGTPAGIGALRALLLDGINVNVTLLFSRAAYRAVAEAYIDAIEARARRGQDCSRLASVASFFVSRIDAEIDARIDARLGGAMGGEHTALEALRGRIAIANAQLAYRDFRKFFVDDLRWQRLERDCGAQPQRLLWASTGTKNPAYRDVRYVEALIGPQTVNTVPPATLDAFRDHGESRATLAVGVNEAEQLIAEAARLGLDLDGVTDQLLQEGLALFQDADDRLNAALVRKRRSLLGSAMPEVEYRLPPWLAGDIEVHSEQWRREQKVRRLWAHDASLWTNTDETQWLAWLHAIDANRPHCAELQAFADAVRHDGYRDIVLLGMGGSSLGPEVLAQVFADRAVLPLRILDSTDPAQIMQLEATLDLTRTLFVVSSKSGSTLEVDLFCRYFYGRVAQCRGAEHAGANFIAITDPGSKLERLAQQLNFRRIFAGTPQIGGRYSVLSNFGLVPAALMGLDVKQLLVEAARMQCASAASVPPADNEGVQLGLVLGVAARAGRDKLTLICPPTLAPFGAWVDQLIAESTGKQGRGIVPIDDEPVGALDEYGDDRVFVQLRLVGQPDAAQDALATSLANAGHPLLSVSLNTPLQLGAEFLRWELATAVAGSVLGLNPFDQPDVEAAKQQTRALLDTDGEQRTDTSALWCVEDGVSLHVDAANATRLDSLARESTLAGGIAAVLAQLQPGDYIALLAFIEMTPGNRRRLQAVRSLVHSRCRVATCLDFGPRYLHSTGQLYKGGSNSGVFVQITADDRAVLPALEHFSTIKAAQAAGDLAVLEARGRRVVRIHLGADLDAGLRTLAGAFETALSGVRLQ